MAGLYHRLRRGIEAMLHADTPDGDLTEFGGDFDLWGSLESRRLRYALAWASYQNTAYRDMHRWSVELRQAVGLYKHARSIYNPTYRTVEFHATHIHGGRLDPLAGDGKETLSALPILTENEDIRPALAKLWQDSQWQINKASWVRQGALCGDVGLKVSVDSEVGQVRLEVIHAKHLKWIEFDRFGKVNGYILEKRVPDPRQPMPGPGRSFRDDEQRKIVTYEERCFRDGNSDRIIWETYLVDGTAQPWDWTGTGAQPTWTADYGFVPLVLTRHIKMVGLDYGLSETHSIGPKIREADDQASKLHDQIRKAVHPAWFYAGVKAPRRLTLGSGSEPGSSSEFDRDESNESERSEVPTVYASDPSARPTPLVFPLQIADTLEALRDQMEEIERDFPELRFDRLRSQGSFPSGEALRIARQPASTKIEERRATYDADLVLIQRMALAIGGYHYKNDGKPDGLEAYAPFDLNAIHDETGEHSIADRPVFAVDLMEEAVERQTQYVAIKAGLDAGLPRRKVLLEAGYSESDIDEMDAWEAEDEAKSIERMQARQEAIGSGEGDPSEDTDTVDDFDDDEE